MRREVALQKPTIPNKPSKPLPPTNWVQPQMPTLALQCPECSKVFAKAKKLNQHLSKHETHIQCKQCPRFFKTHAALAKHSTFVHSMPVKGSTINDIPGYPSRIPRTSLADARAEFFETFEETTIKHRY